jgi:hypothetical protein
MGVCLQELVAYLSSAYVFPPHVASESSSAFTSRVGLGDLLAALSAIPVTRKPSVVSKIKKARMAQFEETEMGTQFVEAEIADEKNKSGKKSKSDKKNKANKKSKATEKSKSATKKNKSNEQKQGDR